MSYSAEFGIAVQLYTLRDLTGIDLPRTMQSVSAIGYRNVELAGFGNLNSSSAVRKALDDAGLRAVSAHYPIEALKAEIGRVIEDCAALDNRHVVMPWLAEEQRPSSASEWRSFADTLSMIGQQLAKHEITFSYHNHDFEFVEFEARHALDILFQQADPRFVKAELDVYWIAFAGGDPLDDMARFAGRLPLLHLKDMAPGPDRRFAPVGTGILDFPAILAAARSAGVLWAIVEQDDCHGQPPLDSLKISFERLREMGAITSRK